MKAWSEMFRFSRRRQKWTEKWDKRAENETENKWKRTRTRAAEQNYRGLLSVSVHFHIHFYRHLKRGTAQDFSTAHAFLLDLLVLLSHFMKISILKIHKHEVLLSHADNGIGWIAYTEYSRFPSRRRRRYGAPAVFTSSRFLLEHLSQPLSIRFFVEEHLASGSSYSSFHAPFQFFSISFQTV